MNSNAAFSELRDYVEPLLCRVQGVVPANFRAIVV